MKKIIKFSAPWCGPCKQFTPTYNTVKEQYPEFQYLEIVLDELKDNQFVKEHMVKTIPTIIGLNGSVEVFRIADSTTSVESLAESFELLNKE